MKKFFLTMSLLSLVGLFMLLRSSLPLDAKVFFGIVYVFGVWVFMYTFLVQIGVKDFRINWRYITFVGFATAKRYWFSEGVLIGILLFLNEPFMGMPSRWIISYYGSHEHIESHGGFFLWPYKLYFNMRGYKGNSLSIEAYDVDKVTYWQPWMNIN